MIDIKKFRIGMFFVFGILLISLISSYTLTNPQYTQFSSSSFFEGSSLEVDPSVCDETGQDFVIQIDPLGCEPSPVRSDLLEEQNVPVFCKLLATKVNPLIDVKAIDGLTVVGDLPSEVAGVGYQPSRAALGIKNQGLESSIMQDIGHAVIVLRQQSNESALENCESGPGGDVCYVEGELKTRIKYDVKNAFGIGKVTRVLPQLTDSEWEEEKNQYSFWNAKGYLRAEQVEDNSAVISVYDAANNKVRSVNLDEGKTSSKIYLPGFTCLSSLEIKLNNLESPDTKIRLKVNDDFVDVKKGEKFLNERCYVSDFSDAGVLKKAMVVCKEDTGGTFGSNSHDLSIAPKVKLSIGETENDYSVGDLLYTYSPEGSARKYSVYLGYVESKSGRNEDLRIGVIRIPEEIDKNELTEDEIDYLGKMSKGIEWEASSGQATLGNLGKNILKNAWNIISRSVSNLYTYIVEGKSYTFITYDGEVYVLGEDSSGLNAVVYGKNIGVVGFAEPVDIEFDFDSTDETKLKEYYDLAEEDFDLILENFASEVNLGGVNLGKVALSSKIGLNLDLGQKRKAAELCEEFDEKYSDPNFVGLFNSCDNLEISNQGTSSVLVSVNGQINRITLYDIVEPSFEEFGAVIKIRGPNGKAEDVRLLRNQPYYLEGFRYREDESIPVQITGAIAVSYKYDTSPTKGVWKWLKSGENVYLPVKGTQHEVPIYRTLNERLVGKDFVEGTRIINAYQNVLLDTESIELLDLDKGKAKVRVSVWGKDALKQIRDTLVSGSNTLVLNEPQSFGSEYSFILSDVNIKKEAKITLIPGIQDVGSQTNFTFKIGIEKRAIQLSPNQIKSRISKLNNTIEDWRDKGENVGKAVETFKNLCLTGGAILVVKNFLSNVGGAGIARKEVMEGKGGWKEKCEGMSGKDKEFKSVAECITKNAAEIDKQVNEMKKIMNDQNKDIDTLQEDHATKNSLGQSDLDTAGYMKEAIPKVKALLDTLSSNKKFDFKDSSGNVIDYSKFLKYDDWKDNQGIYNVQTLRDIERYARVIGSSSTNDLIESSKSRLISILSQIQAAYSVPKLKSDSFGRLGLEPHIGTDKGTKKIYFSKEYTFENVKEKFDTTDLEIAPKQKVQGYLDGVSGVEYLLLISNNGVVTKTYQVDDSKLIDKGVNALNLLFIKRDPSSYKDNVIKNPQVKYYDTEPYKGMPAVVPFDKQNGWYVYVQQALPNGVQSYDKSGRINSFYLCNVGENGIIERTSEDDCSMIRQGVVPDSISGITDKRQVKELIDKAFKAVEQAKSRPSGGAGEITILGTAFSIGSPAANIAGIECEDFMYAQDCKILFNLCDPVMCPSDRCNFGGKYPVKDPIQSGIIGGLILCLPNFKQGIIVPICLSGVKAGIDALVSTLGAYRDCLQVSLDTGKTVGACDEVHSVYLCDFFWKQAKPLIELGLPKIISVLVGESQVRGGGNYLNVANSWDTAKGSMNYFVQTYAADSVNAFKARATKEIQGSVCGNFASGIIPDIGDLSFLGEPASPPQFTGRLTVIPFSTVTNPPTSHYKVFYRIYAGESNPASYRVYLTGEGDSSYFKDASGTRLVAQGTVAPGDTVIESEDFTAPTGYKKLCINVNGQEECGFKEVSTSFALDFVKDQYIDQQATQTNINSEKACVSGTVSGYSLLQTPSAAVEELSNPDISNYGIIRFCATSNPGAGTDPFIGTDKSRFREVGNCGSPNLKCWLDTDSLKGITEFAATQDNILSDLSTNVLEGISKKESDNIEEIYNEVTSLSNSISDEEKLPKINQIIDKVFFNQQKAILYFNRGLIYNNFASDLFGKIKRKKDNERAKAVVDRLDFQQSGTTGTQTTTDQSQGEDTQTPTQQDSGENIFTRITDVERAIINSVNNIQDCNKCGGGYFDTNVCDSIECAAISDAVKKIDSRAYCQYNNIIRGCSTQTSIRDQVPVVPEGQAVV